MPVFCACTGGIGLVVCVWLVVGLKVGLGRGIWARMVSVVVLLGLVGFVPVSSCRVPPFVRLVLVWVVWFLGLVVSCVILLPGVYPG